MIEPQNGPPWWVEWDDRDARRCDSLTAVLAYLDELHETAKALPRRTRISGGKYSPMLTMGLGQGFSFLGWEGIGFAPQFVSVGDESATGTVEWTWLNHKSGIARAYHIPFAKAREGAAWFVETLERAPFVRWKELKDPK